MECIAPFSKISFFLEGLLDRALCMLEAIKYAYFFYFSKSRIYKAFSD